MTYDRQLTISTAGTRRATVWTPNVIWWSDFVAKLSVPVHGVESLTEYLRLPKAKQDELKDVGGFVGGRLKGNRRKAGNVAERDLITLDLDNIEPGGTRDVLRRVGGLGCAYCVYSTRKHEEARPRLRVTVPLDRAVTADEYEAVARKLAEILGLSLCDPTTFEPSRLMYWPSVCAGASYVYAHGDNPFLSAEGMLALYANWRDITTWPRLESEAVKRPESNDKQGDPCGKPGLVGAFCRVYDVRAALDAFLPGIYAASETNGRLTYVKGSTTGGAVLYDDGKFLFSHHSTDPAGGRLCNAFDLVRLHKFGDLDADAAPDTPVNRLPSYIAMQRFTAADGNVTALMTLERVESAREDFGKIAEPGASYDWLRGLKNNPNTGRPELSIDNAVLILEHDPLLKNRVVYDEFENEIKVKAPLPWDAPGFNRRLIADNDEANLRHYLEKTYGITGESRIADALSIHAHRHKEHEVKEYLNSLTWDGVLRLDMLFVDYFGAADTPYTRAAARKTLVSAVARVMMPGVKKDEMVILAGKQGTGKSTFLRKLGKQWFSNGIKSFDGKNAAELLRGAWILEIEEMSAYNRTEINQIKAFLSTNADHFRAAYAKNASKNPRQCVFIGTSNESDFLRDATGERRFWPVKLDVQAPSKSVFKDLDDEVDQIWAEALTRWRIGETLYLTGTALALSAFAQEEFSAKSPRAGMIIDFVARKVPPDWQNRKPSERTAWAHADFVGDEAELVPRDRISAIEVYVELLGGEPKMCKYSDITEINAVIRKMGGWEYQSVRTPYGIVKGWARKSI
jgi:predicted P-loop ATPase